MFSTQDERTLSFDEFMNLCSVFSENSPLKVKASWAFMIFDFDEDNKITVNDLYEMIDRIIQPMLLSEEEKDTIRGVVSFKKSMISFFLVSGYLRYLCDPTQRVMLFVVLLVTKYSQAFVTNARPDMISL